ncbi:1-acyl-sn-glycerol-3-phosphate acyltransferase [Treponema sp.]|uniref:lysophospholipid acyltransferase family protein n=1 Tax=Treponema sp. TaxID=166 RepID=UPI0025FC36B4|nr:lysophospholipid acyltransferase family protein [Treponema sp.]MCR5218051.1 1-acyl-sn-glycerol-3-phosphate acyltransferase [Treponema sp.]
MKEIDPRYDHSELPFPKNPLLHFYRCLGKCGATIFFTIGGFFLGAIIFPLIFLLSWNKKTFKRRAQNFISITFRQFLFVLQLLQLLELNVEDRAVFKNLKSTVVVANHPSIMDVVILISLIKNADCIVRGGLIHTPFVFVIKYLYLVNTLGSEEMFTLADKSLNNGTNLIVFPEGTRTPRHGKNTYKRGAGHIAFKSRKNILPVYIGGSDKYGLGKHDPFFSFLPDSKIVYNIKPLKEIQIEKYSDLEEQIAARRITEGIESVLSQAAEKEIHDNKNDK